MISRADDDTRVIRKKLAIAHVCIWPPVHRGAAVVLFILFLLLSLIAGGDTN